MMSREFDFSFVSLLLHGSDPCIMQTNLHFKMELTYSFLCNIFPVPIANVCVNRISIIDCQLMYVWKLKALPCVCKTSLVSKSKLFRKKFKLNYYKWVIYKNL